MVNLATPATASIPPSANEVALETATTERQLRRQRIQQLREAVERGHYHVSAEDLATALLRSSRQAN